MVQAPAARSPNLWMLVQSCSQLLTGKNLPEAPSYGLGTTNVSSLTPVVSFIFQSVTLSLSSSFGERIIDRLDLLGHEEHPVILIGSGCAPLLVSNSSNTAPQVATSSGGWASFTTTDTGWATSTGRGGFLIVQVIRVGLPVFFRYLCRECH